MTRSLRTTYVTTGEKSAVTLYWFQDYRGPPPCHTTFDVDERNGRRRRAIRVGGKRGWARDGGRDTVNEDIVSRDFVIATLRLLSLPPLLFATSTGISIFARGTSIATNREMYYLSPKFPRLRERKIVSCIPRSHVDCIFFTIQFRWMRLYNTMELTEN